MRTGRVNGIVGSVTVLLAVLAPAAGASEPEPERSVPDKSFAVYVGKNQTQNGRPLRGGFGHEPSSHWVDIVPGQEHPEGSTIEVGATGEASIPGELTEIPQARRTARYITSNYSEFAGFPAPLTNGGLNEHGVAARDVWSPSREELVEQTPTPQRGPQYSDLSRIVMERARSAREAVRIAGDLINKHGYTTYGGNSHLFADADEGWVLVEMAGGEGLWAAERLGPDDVRVSYPGYIGDFPADWRQNPNYMASPNLVDYAKQRGWWSADSGEPFNVQDVYGTPFPGNPVGIGEQADPGDPSPYRHPPSLEAEFRELEPVKLQDVMRIVRDPRWSDDRSGYGQVAELNGSLEHSGMAKLWVATTAAVTAPYIPVYIGTRSMPPEYRQHRYLTHNAASEFIDPEFAEQEATEYATQTYKRLLYATCSREGDALDTVTEAFEGFEAKILQNTEDVESEARQQFADGDTKQARNTLTRATGDWARDGLRLGGYLLDQQLDRIKDNGGIHSPRVPVPRGDTSGPRNQDMSLRSEETARDRMNCDQGGGWSGGGTLAKKGDYGDPGDVPDYREDGAGGWWPYALTGAGGLLVGAAAMWLVRRRFTSNAGH